MNCFAKSIISPMAVGNGAHVLHKMIEKHIKGYRVVDYSPWLTLVPFILPRLIRSVRCDLIHTTPDYGLFFVKQKTPLVLTIHNYVCDPSFRSYSSLLQRIHYSTDLKWFIASSLKLADTLISVSRYTADLVAREFNLGRTIRVIYNGIDEKAFCPASNRKESSKVQVLFSGNLTRRKGAHWLPAISRGLEPGIEMHHASGLRPTRRHMDASDLIDLGRVRYEDMPGLYRKYDILLAPTVREGLSLSILEAMACGLPVVATKCSSIPEQIEDGKGGFLCRVGKAEDFAERINLLASSPGLRREMGEFNRAKVEKMFTLNRMITDYRELFESLI